MARVRAVHAAPAALYKKDVSTTLDTDRRHFSKSLVAIGNSLSTRFAR